MKTLTRLFGIIAIMAIITFSMAACDTGGDTGNGGESGVAELKFTNEQVYEVANEAWIPYTGSTPVTSSIGGSGSISNGRLTFTIGEPTSLFPLANVVDGSWNPSVNPSGVLAANLHLNLNEGRRLSKTGGDFSGSTFWMEYVYYLYVDTDCTVTLPALSDGDYTRPATTLSLKKGWNAVSDKVSGTMGGSFTGEIKVTNFAAGDWVIPDF